MSLSVGIQYIYYIHKRYFNQQGFCITLCFSGTKMRVTGGLGLVLNEGLKNFSSKTEVTQLGLAQLGTFIARACSSQKISARTHLYIIYLYNINQFPRTKLHNWDYTNQQVGKLVPSMLHLTHASSQLGQSIFHFSWLVWSYIASSFFFGTRPEKTSTFLYQVQTFLRLVISYKMDTWGSSTAAHSVHVWIWIKS